MFGFLNPQTCNINYRSLYSRCCQHQRRNYGILSIPTLSYEGTFSYALGLELGTAGGYRPPLRRCCMLRADKIGPKAPDAELGRFAASLGTLLTGIKIRDDISDSRSSAVRAFRKAQWRAQRGRYRRANEYFTRLDEDFNARIEATLKAQREAEAKTSGLSLDDFFEPTSKGFGYVFSLMSRLPKLSAFEQTLRQIGKHVGTAMIAADCVSDWEHDMRRRLPNPIRNESRLHDAQAKLDEHLNQAILLAAGITNSQSISTAVLRGVAQRVRSKQTCAEGCATTANPSAANVTLNIICCVPCGDGAVAVDTESGECQKCLSSCSICCCLGCCFCSSAMQPSSQPKKAEPSSFLDSDVDRT